MERSDSCPRHMRTFAYRIAEASDVRPLVLQLGVRDRPIQGVARMGLARLIHDLHPAASAPFIQRQTVRDPKKSGTRPVEKIIFARKVIGVTSNICVGLLSNFLEFTRNFLFRKFFPQQRSITETRMLQKMHEQ